MLRRSEHGSPLISLSPYVDEQNLLRVEERLQAPQLSVEAKHPIILRYDHTFTDLTMDNIRGHTNLGKPVGRCKEKRLPDLLFSTASNAQ